jgi:hypothetical protein
MRGSITIVGAVAMFGMGYFVVDRYDSARMWRTPARSVLPAESLSPPDATQADATTSTIRFDDQASALGVDFTFFDGAQGEFHLVETTGGGVAVGDFDSDGLLDLFFVNGCRLEQDGKDRSHASRLFANRAALGFGDVTEAARIEFAAFGQGAAVGDFDNDGFDDLLVAGFRTTALYRNQGDGTFANVTGQAGVENDRWSTSAAFADLDQDGALDLYVCTYAEIDLKKPLHCARGSIRTHCGPLNYPAQQDLLFRNQHDGTFIETARDCGVIDANGRGLGVVVADLDGDGRPDVFIANDNSENALFLNRGGLRFEETGLRAGVALRAEGSIMAGMGVACGDYDGNGWLDLFVTDFYEAENALFTNLGKRGFLDAAATTGLGASSRDRLGFGTVFLDADLDGYLDLFVANGHISDLTPLGIPYRMRQQLYRGGPDARFADVSASAGTYFHLPLLGRGVAVGDFDNNGLPDLACNHLRDQAALLINRSSEHGNWLGFDLVGSRSNRNGRNVKLRVTVADKTQVFEAVAGGSYLSSSDPRLLIGLGESAPRAKIELHWPSGAEQHLTDLAAHRYHLIREPIDGLVARVGSH